MSVIKKVLLGAAMFALASTAVNAAKDDSVYAGLVWELGQSATIVPSVTVGARSLNVNSGSSVDGADLSLRIKLKDGFAFDSSRLVYVGGDRDLMGNIGVGYSFVDKDILATVAIQGPYIRAGVDFQIQNKALKPYVEVNTLSKPDRVKANRVKANLVDDPLVF
jgi:hypothetical protein